MTVRFYKSTDAGATALTGQVGKITTILDDCLVNGYNSKTITITRSGGTATATCTAHGFLIEQRILVSGAGQSEYNGEFEILSVPTTDTFTYAVTGTPATPATGTITAKMAPCNWTITHTATNKRVYRGPDGFSGNRRYWRIEDNNETAVGANYFRFQGYDSMTSIDAGVQAFPATAQISGGGGVIKSNTADATARPWCIIADEKTVYLWIDRLSDSGANSAVCVFGDYNRIWSADTNNSIVCSEVTFATSNANRNFFTYANKYGPKNVANYGVPITLNLKGWSNETTMAGWGLQYPNPIDSSLPICPITVWESWAPVGSILRGYMPGLWALGNAPSGVAHYDTFSGANGAYGNLSGKKFMIWRFYSVAGVAIQYKGNW